MKEIIEYKILTENTPKMLEDKTNKCIREGWQPYGWPFEMKESGWDLVAQAVVKYKEE